MDRLTQKTWEKENAKLCRELTDLRALLDEANTDNWRLQECCRGFDEKLSQLRALLGECVKYVQECIDLYELKKDWEALKLARTLRAKLTAKLGE